VTLQLRCKEQLHVELVNFLARAENVPRGGWWHDLLRAADATRIEALLREEPSLNEFQQHYVRENGSGAGTVDVDSLVSWLAGRALTVGAEASIHELETYAISATFPIRFLVGVRGITLDRTIDLGGGVTLSNGSDDLDFLRGQAEVRPWTAALSVTVDFPKRSRAFDPAKHATDRTAEASRVDAFERLNVARMCVALANNSRVVEVTRASRLLVSVPEGRGYAGASTQYAPPVSEVPLDDAQLHRSRSLHVRFVGIPQKLRSRLAVALHRWHACLLHGGVTPDVFVDIGIGLECVFLSEETAELKHRLTIRAARLLGGASLQSRLEIAKVVGLLYDARSRAVHRGVLLDKFKGERPRDVYDLAFLGDHFLREAILRMTERGRDDWDELVLG
jgi:hypothetical protein